MKIGRFDTPLEDYSKDLRKVKTFADLKAMQEKYSLILSDAKPVFEAMTEEDFPEFIKYLPIACDKNLTDLNMLWAKKYGAIVLPYLFLQIAPFLNYGMGSGFVMHRLMDEGLAEIKDGLFVVNEDEINRRSKI